ncbi:MAG TPA: thioesterase family protein [Bacteroidia bacterium]|jgi:acyl-CoA thioester hydrolase|nr:thioesterase family protein [Bacteroidia bacterium]HRG53654.1 thioesterase family protein [Bacteroidia bacterium]
MNSFRHKTPIQIRFKDIDRLGHVNNANHITYFELARVDYFNTLMGRGTKIDWDNESLILARMEMDYKQPIFLEDKISVYTWVSRMGSKSFDMSCSIVKEIEGGAETEVAKGLAVIVCFNYKLNQTIPIPEGWKEKMLMTS